MKRLCYIILILSSFIITSCSAPNNDLYYWGNYSDVVYSYYNEDGDFAKQADLLNQIISQAKAENKQVAPGVYGQLGLVLVKQGKLEDAKAAFQEEQRLYPESTVFMQYLQHHKN